MIAAEREHPDPGRYFDPNDDVAIPSLVAAELLLGVELADSAHRDERGKVIDHWLSTLTIESYDLDVARTHARLMAETRRSGRPRGAHDLIIAATALARDRTIVTADARAFPGLSGVSFEVVG